MNFFTETDKLFNKKRKQSCCTKIQHKENLQHISKLQAFNEV